MCIFVFSDSYSTGTIKSNTCPPGGTRLTEDECKQAAITLKGKYKWTHDWSGGPTGCYVQSKVFYYYNKHKFGAPSSGRSPVCKGEHLSSDNYCLCFLLHHISFVRYSIYYINSNQSHIASAGY